MNLDGQPLRTPKNTARGLGLLGLLVALSAPLHAHLPAPYEDPAASTGVAERVTRLYLARQGLSRSLGPGGAHIGAIRTLADRWIVDVSVRDSATRARHFAVHVDRASRRVTATEATRAN